MFVEPPLSCSTRLCSCTTQISKGTWRGGEGQTTSRGYRMDDDGFLHRIPRRSRAQQSLVTGRKSGTALRAAPVVKRIKIFVSRLDPSETTDSMREYVRGLTGTECVIERLKSKFPTYSSFVITCDKQFENILLNPDEWEEGLLVRPFFGKIRKHDENKSGNDHHSEAVSVSGIDKNIV